MQLATTVTKSLKRAQDTIENDISNQLKIMTVKLFNNGIKLYCYAILDNCSNCSYIFSKTAETLRVNQTKNYSLAYEVLSVKTKCLTL